MVSIDKARHFVHANGTMWERALWDHLFDGGSIERVHQCLLCYKNKDGGWGHGLEHDIKCPDSNPLQLEFLLSIVRDTGIPVGNLLDGTANWVEDNLNQDGTLKNPPTLLDYPHAPWWGKGGQSLPDSITGNLIKWGFCTPKMEDSTKKWAMQHLTLPKIRTNDWLFRAYHAHDYFMNVKDFPNLEQYREATIENIIHCAQLHSRRGETNKYLPLFMFATSPESEIAKAMPAGLIDRFLAQLASSQRDDGGWDDEHGLAYWQPYFSTVILLALRHFNRLS